MHSVDKNLCVHTYIYFFAKLSALCTKRTNSIDIQRIAQCRHHQKSYTPLCARASAQCEVTTTRERFYGIGRQKNLFIRQKFCSPYTVKPLSYNRNGLPWRVMLQVGVQLFYQCCPVKRKHANELKHQAQALMGATRLASGKCNVYTLITRLSVSLCHNFRRGDASPPLELAFGA